MKNYFYKVRATWKSESIKWSLWIEMWIRIKKDEQKNPKNLDRDYIQIA